MKISRTSQPKSARKNPRPKPQSAAEVTTTDLYRQAEKNGDKPYRSRPSLGVSILGIIGRTGPIRPGPSMTRLQRNYNYLNLDRGGRSADIMKDLRSQRNSHILKGSAGVAGALASFGAAAFLATQSETVAIFGTALGGLAGIASSMVAHKELKEGIFTNKILKQTETYTDQILDRR